MAQLRAGAGGEGVSRFLLPGAPRAGRRVVEMGRQYRMGVPSFIKRGLDEVAALRAEAGGQLLF